MPSCTSVLAAARSMPRGRRRLSGQASCGTPSPTVNEQRGDDLRPCAQPTRTRWSPGDDVQRGGKPLAARAATSPRPCAALRCAALLSIEVSPSFFHDSAAQRSAAFTTAADYLNAFISSFINSLWRIDWISSWWVRAGFFCRNAKFHKLSMRTF